MLLEHTFIFLPGILFLLGIILFVWIALRLTFGSKKVSTRYKTDLKTVLHSIQTPEERISLEKYNQYIASVTPIQSTPCALADKVYPDQQTVSQTKHIQEEMKTLYDTIHQDIQQYTRAVQSFDKSEAVQVNRDAMTAIMLPLQEEKQTLIKTMERIQTQIDEALEGKEKILNELITRYDDRPTQTVAPQLNAAAEEKRHTLMLHNLLAEIQQVRHETYERTKQMSFSMQDLKNKEKNVFESKGSSVKQIVQDFMQKKSALEVEISSLKTRVTVLQNRMPQMIQEKEEQISQMTTAVELFENRLKQEEEMAATYCAHLNRHMQYQVDRAQEILEKQTMRSQEKMVSLQQELERMITAATEEQEKIKHELKEKKTVLGQEYAVLARIKEEVISKLKTMTDSFEKQKAVLDIEIAQLKQRLNEKEKEFNNAVTVGQEKKNSEKQRLISILNALKDKTKKLQEDNARAQIVHAERLQRIIADSKAVIEQINDEGKQACARKISEIQSLKEFIETEKKRIELNRQSWFEMEKKLIEERDRIRNLIEVCDKEMVQQQEKQHASYIMETADLNQQIKSVEDELAKTQTEFKAHIEKQAWELECLTVKEKRNEEQAKEAWLARETDFSKEKESLENELKNLNEHLARSGEAAEKKRQELSDSIKALRKELSQKKEYADSLTQQREREYRKMIQPLFDKLNQIKEQLVSEKRMYEVKSAEYDERLRTMKLRLAWRDERQQASEQRRLKEIEKFKEQLYEQIEELRGKSKKISNRQDRMLEPYMLECERLTQELHETEEKLSNEKTAYAELKKNRMQIESEIKNIQDRLPHDLEQYEQLLQLKEQQLKMLDHEIRGKEQQIDAEEVISREAMQRLRNTYRTVKLQAGKKLLDEVNQPTDQETANQEKK